MRQIIIVVTGNSGTGKTELCSRLASLLGFQHINVGDLLLRHLLEMGIEINCREKIGSLFFEHYSFDDYLTILRKCALPGVIIDGVRFARAVQYLRTVVTELFHVHRTPRNRFEEDNKEYSQEDYVADSELLEGIADYTLGWSNTLDDLDTEIKRLFGC